jgi:hypothetical protein
MIRTRRAALAQSWVPVFPRDDAKRLPGNHAQEIQLRLADLTMPHAATAAMSNEISTL